MTAEPLRADDNREEPSLDFDLDFDIDDLDEETLRRLLDGGSLEGEEAVEEEVAALPEEPDEDENVAHAAADDMAAPALSHDDAPQPDASAERTDEDIFGDLLGAGEEGDPFGARLPSVFEQDAGEVEPVIPAAEALQGQTFAPVPRIDIHVFCESDDLLALFERAAADRRFSKAHLTMQQGDAFKAAQVYTYEPTPSLIVIEGGRSAKALLDGLAALAEVCDPSSQVMVVGAINDITLYRKLMEQGVSDYLVRPKSPLEIVAAISGLYADPSAPPVGRTICFLGARGGTGSSTVCHNVAWAMAETLKSDTVLMDLDLAFGTASLDFERDPSQGLSEALSAPDRLDDVLLDRLLQKCTDRLSLFAAPNLLDRDYELAGDSVEQVIDLVRAGAPSVAIDLPHIWSSWALSTILSADEIVVTATPDLAAFRNAKNIFETVAGARGDGSKPVLVLNQTGMRGRPEIAPAQFEEALGVEPRIIVPFDAQLFGTAATNAQSVCESAPKSKPAAAFLSLARSVLNKDEKAGSAKRRGIKSLLSVMR